ncbi:MAG: ATP-binding protein [Cyclobacteriaceae bacterium]
MSKLMGHITNNIVSLSITILLTVAVYLPVSSQPPGYDSLEVVQLNDVAWALRNTYPDSTVYYAGQAVEIAMVNGMINEQIRGLNYVGVGQRNMGNYGLASTYYMAALRASDQYNNQKQKGYTLINLGNIYLYQKDYEQSLDYTKRAMVIADELDNKDMIAYCYLNLGRTYRSSNRYEEAQESFQKSLDIRKNINDTMSAIALKVEIAEVLRLQGSLDESLKYYESGLDDINDIKNYGALSYAHNNMSKIYLEKGALNEAEIFARSAMTVAEQLKDKYDYHKALESLAMIYEAKGQYEKALKYLKMFTSAKDSVFNESNTRNVERIISTYESDKIKDNNERLVESNRQQKIFIILASIGIVLLLAVIIVIFIAYHTRKRLNNEILLQKDRIEKDKDLIEKQSKKLEELDRAKSRFFTNISHDLRSPLSLIIGNIENVIENEDNYLSPVSKESLDTGYKNSKRLLYLADEINELTKLEEGKLHLEKEVVDIEMYMKLLVKMFSSAAEYKSIDLTFKSDVRGEAIIEVDPRHFEKIIYNLISNAIEHTPNDGKVSVTLRQVSEDLVIDIKDSGEGISPQSLPYIFDRYYQSPTNQFRMREGLGIGLALVKELVDLHKGDIKVDSELEKGTTFSIYLPLKEKHSTTEVVTPEQSTYIKDKNHLWSELLKKNQLAQQHVNLTINNLEEGKDKTILLVDDHPEVREYIKNLLIGYFVILEAGNGKEALEVLRNHEIDLVITDLMMPWMDGFELLSAMKDDTTLSRIPALVVSARTNDEDKRKVLFSGINNILYKPFDKKELLLRINNLIAFKDHIKQDSVDKLLISNSQTIDDIEKGILEKIDSLIIENIDNPSLSVNHLGDVLAASERKVYRMIKKLTGMTPLEYIKEVRWKYLEVLIREKNVKNATEAAKSIGINNVTKFKQQYEKKFGKKIDAILDYGVD